jgi:hypothetical protein
VAEHHSPAEEPRARNNPDPAEIRERGEALASAIYISTGDARVIRDLLAVLDTTTANEGMCSACGEWLGRGREGGCESCSEFAQESGWNEYTSSLTEEAEARCVALTKALDWYAERRNYVLAGGEPSCQQHGSDTCAPFHSDAYDGKGPGARARAVLAAAGSSAAEHGEDDVSYDADQDDYTASCLCGWTTSTYAMSVAEHALREHIASAGSSANPEESTPVCEICGTTEDLRVAPIMTGDRFGQPPKHPVCSACFRAWHDHAGTTPEEIRAYRAKHERAGSSAEDTP